MSWISFDCYGTLVDWERGILDVLRPVLQLPNAKILALFARHEAELEAGRYRSYGDILREIGARLGVGDAVAASLPRWAPFPDTADALRRLGRRHKLAVLSNVDDDLFTETARALGITFDAVVTAAQCRSYKPSPANFRALRERIGEDPLHCAQSLYHDHVPARALGWKTAWVNRAGAVIGTDVDVRPDLVVPDLGALASALGC